MSLTAVRRAGLDIISHSVQQTRELGAALARRLQPGDLILMSGTLGAGKTTFIQGIAAGLHIADQVSSPTFTLVSEYDAAIDGGTPVRFFHIDLYRIKPESDELDSFGLDEYLDDPAAICALEWPQRAASFLPSEWLLVELESVAETKRRSRLIARGARYEELVHQIRSEASRGRS